MSYRRFFLIRLARQRSPIALDPINVRFAFPKGKNADIREAVDAALREQKMDRNSTWHRALEYWLEGYQLQRRFPQWVIWTLLGATAIFLIVFAHSMVLRSEVRRKTQQLQRDRACVSARSASS